MDDVSVPIPGGRINVWHRPASADADTVVLVHGLSGNSRWWGSVIEYLPERQGIIAPDVRGRAGSVDAPAPYDLSTLAEDVVRCLDYFHIDRATVTGYSMGGWIATLFGLGHANRCQRLVLVDGGFPIRRDPDAVDKDVIEAVVGSSLRRAEMHFDNEEDLISYWKTHPAIGDYWDDSMRSALVHELEADGGRYRVKANQDSLQTAAREIVGDKEVNEAGSRLQVPAHLIVIERGTMDQPGGMIPRHTAEEAAASNPQMTMDFLSGLNHFTLILGQGAEKVAAAIATG